jgi:hypothetical protein
MNTLSSALAALCLIFCLCVFAPPIFAGDEQWQPIPSAELSLKEPKIEKDADAEVLYWEVYVANEDGGTGYETVQRHYLRIKIFNERGREQFSKIDIPYIKFGGVRVRIKDLAARTTKADGSVVELKEADIFERDVVKGDGLKLKAKSFAVPGIEPGAIIEYRWKEVSNVVSFYQRLEFAREIPVHSIKYYIKPVPDPRYGMRGQGFNVQNTPFAKEKNGFYSTTVSNVGSFKTEPQMPSEFAVRPWMLLYYTAESGKPDPAKYWKEHGKMVYERNKLGIKINDEVRAATTAAVGDAAAPEQKVERIFNFVRAKIKNVYDDAHKFTDEEKKRVQENKTPAGTLKLGYGDNTDINRLFVAMVTAAGIEARITNLPRRSDVNFNINFADDYFMRTSNVAVKIGDKWQYVDPAIKYLPYGMLTWEEEGQPVLISDPKEPIWAETQVSAPQKSLEKRTGKFKLTEDGTLEGVMRLEYTGHAANFHKEYNDEDTPQQREDTLKNLVRYNVLGSAEISEVKIENVEDPDKPFIYTFKIKVPGYATRTGKRLFVQPNAFERSAKPMFEATTRRYDVQFRFPYSEEDYIELIFPEGFTLESPDAPAPLKDNQNIGLNEVSMGITKDGKTLIYKRKFYFGNNGMLNFPVQSYPALKNLFEAFHKINVHSLTLKQDAPATVSSK